MNIVDLENKIYFCCEPTEAEKQRILKEDKEEELRKLQEEMEQYGYDDCI